MASDPQEATIDYLRSWEENGATWRPLELSHDHAVVELCTCYGETVDWLRSEDPTVIEFVRARRDES